MPRTYTACIKWSATYNVTCELCGHSFSFGKGYESRGGLGIGFYSRESAGAEALRNMINSKSAIQHGNFTGAGVTSCPKCGYIQSWMIENTKATANKYFDTVLLCGVGALSLGGLYLWGLFLISRGDRSLEHNFLLSLFANVGLPLLAVISLIGLAVYVPKYRKFNREFNPNAKILENHPAPVEKKLPTVSFSP